MQHTNMNYPRVKESYTIYIYIVKFLVWKYEPI
jgi:hypothetical protein